MARPLKASSTCADTVTGGQCRTVCDDIAAPSAGKDEALRHDRKVCDGHFCQAFYG